MSFEKIDHNIRIISSINKTVYFEELLRLDEMNVKRGLTKEEFESLPKFEYKSNNEIDMNESDRTCSICQDEFENKARLTALTCTHKFHRKCIKEWLNVILFQKKYKILVKISHLVVG